MVPSRSFYKLNFSLKQMRYSDQNEIFSFHLQSLHSWWDNSRLPIYRRASLSWNHQSLPHTAMSVCWMSNGLWLVDQSLSARCVFNICCISSACLANCSNVCRYPAGHIQSCGTFCECTNFITETTKEDYLIWICSVHVRFLRCISCIDSLFIHSWCSASLVVSIWQMACFKARSHVRGISHATCMPNIPDFSMDALWMLILVQDEKRKSYGGVH